MGLTPGLTYYFRAYATNSIGTAYGNQVTTTTIAVLPTITTTAISVITVTTAMSGGNITNDGGSSVTTRGVCWSTSQNPTIADSKTSDATGSGIFTSSITGLTPGATYYIRAYATNSIGTAYGNQVTTTTTAILPTITTTAISVITATTATSGGNINNDGGSPVIARGVCWSTSQNPTITGSNTTNGTGTGSFTSSITGLKPGATYYISAYATNSIGTNYGNQISFNTLATIPTITTAAITEITPATAGGGGTITSDGGAVITARGVCWSIGQTPTIADSLTTDGTGAGSFTSRLTDLTETTTYSVRAYATNSAGTGYGNAATFTTLTRSIESDYKPTGLILATMSEMLSIPTVESTNPLSAPILKSSGTLPPDFYLGVPLPGNQGYQSCAAWAVGYGMLSYIFKSIEGHENYNGYDRVFSPNYIWNQKNGGLNQGIKIGGAFRLIREQGCCKLSFMQVTVPINSDPSAAAKANAANYKLTDFNRFELFDINKFKSYIVAGFPLVIGVNVDNAFQPNGKSQFEEKSDGRLVWKKYKDNARDGHAMLICGYDDDINAFKVLNSWGTDWGNEGYFWLDYAFLKDAIAHPLGPLFYEIYIGFVKRPVVSTNAVTEITNNTAKCGGTIIKDWNYTVTEKGICWSTNPDPYISNNRTFDGTGTGVFLSTITGLSPGTTYYIKAYAINSQGPAYGKEVSFTTGSVTPVVPTLTTTAASSITSITAKSGGNITSDGGALVTARGVCWSTSVNPTTALSTKTTDGTGTGSFISSITGLTANTTYYVRAYATNSAGTAYGLPQISFKTLQNVSTPTVTTTSVTTYTTTSATVGGNVTASGGTTVSERGVYWGTSQNPQTTGTKLQIGSGTGLFSTSLSGLIPNTTYYIKAYAINSAGTAYGTQESFTTNSVSPVVPTLTTTAVSSITSTTATSGGNISSDGGVAVTAKGVCWSTTSNPTTALSTKTTDGTGTGSFTSSITGLTANTTYYVRAYATNSAGTAYGLPQVSFTTSSSGQLGTVTDTEGNIYKTITIGTQTWMAENLKTIKYNDGTTIPLVTDGAAWAALSTPGYCWYNNDVTNKSTYGALYNWYTVNTGKLCPAGWHVPSYEEWTTLTTYLGGDMVAVWKLIETGTSHWQSPNTGATNSSGFTALPGGSRVFSTFFSTFGGVGVAGSWWSSTVHYTGFVLYWALNYGNSYVGSSIGDKGYGFSVRCMKD